jgi:ferritin-like metal-binding protein YciE
MELKSLRELYIDELKDLYSAEKQLVKALPKMVRLANAPDLKEEFANHLEETRVHVERLEQIFTTLEASPRGKKCVGMEGLIEEANELAEEDPQEDVLDAGLISKAQHVEHYEMAGYGTVRTYALTLGEREHADLLQQTLDEEANADTLLTQLAEASVNIDAAMGDREVSRSASDERSSSQRPGKHTGKTGTRKSTGESRAR